MNQKKENLGNSLVIGYFRGGYKVKTDGDKTLRILNPEWTGAALDTCVVHASPSSSRPFPFFRNQEPRGTGGL